MGNLTPSERPANPRPLCETMPRAVAAAIHAGNSLGDIKLDRWAMTYRCGVDEVRAEWERQMSVKSQAPDNAFDCEGK